MSLRNLWSLQPGEVIVAEMLDKKVKRCQIYFPMRDIGIDLLAARNNKHVGIQVKESRYHIKGGARDRSWHQVKKKRLAETKKGVDFYIFLTYLPRLGEHKYDSFEYKFVIVPTDALAKRLTTKNAGSKGIYSFYFHFEGKKVTEIRDEPTDYSKFLNNWTLIDKSLSK